MAHSKHGTSTHCSLNAGPPSRRWLNTKPTPVKHTASTGPEPLHVQPALAGDHETRYAQSNRKKYIIELFNNTKYYKIVQYKLPSCINNIPDDDRTI